ncbi:MAG: glycosyltransferase family 2 protein [Propionibacteriaceae bacterium]|nr:glycosyltransferase family 2 protein [Propionibacteriaceae bacterium]
MLPLPKHPGVSYIMPVLNEAEHLEAAVAGILAQKYDGEAEVILALGNSTDGTSELAESLAAADPRIQLVRNPANDVPIGLNLAIRASKYPVIIRVDAHSELPPDYTAELVGVLASTDAVNVGGVMLAKGDGPVQEAIARAYNSPFGLGGAAYHGGRTDVPMAAESAYLGVYRREIFDEVGYFDESMRRAQDWELNYRIRQQGYVILFDPGVEVGYWPRASFGALRKQMYATGVWRGALVRRQGKTPLRYLAPPLLVLGLLASLGIALTGAGGRRWLAGCLPALYILGLTGVSFTMPGRSPFGKVLNVLTLAVIHISWGLGFLRGLLRGAGSTVDKSRA